MEEHDIAGLKAHDLTSNFIMALNGAFFTTRRIGVKSMPHEIESAKRSVQIASYIFINSLNDLINIYDSTCGTQVTQVNQKVINIAVQLVKAANTAIASGIGNKAAAYLGNKTHGATGELVGRLAQTLDVSVRDTAGRKWGDPARLMQTIVRDHIYQQEVDFRIDRLIQEGEKFFVVGNQAHQIDSFYRLRDRLFHPNSSNLPEKLNVPTKS